MTKEQKEEIRERFSEKLGPYFRSHQDEMGYHLLEKFIEEETSKAYSQGREDKVREVREEIKNLELSKEQKSEDNPFSIEPYDFDMTKDITLSLPSLQLPDNKLER